ncbi:460_t:CDS:1, partial [Funneliformis mosseae]
NISTNNSLLSLPEIYLQDKSSANILKNPEVRTNINDKLYKFTALNEQLLYKSTTLNEKKDNDIQKYLYNLLSRRRMLRHTNLSAEVSIGDIRQ